MKNFEKAELCRLSPREAVTYLKEKRDQLLIELGYVEELLENFENKLRGDDEK